MARIRSARRRPRSRASGGRDRRSTAPTLTISNLQDLEAHGDKLQRLLGPPDRSSAADHHAKIEEWLDGIERRGRLGLGTFIAPEIVDRFLARQLFFRAIRRVTPDVVEALRDLLPVYQLLDAELVKIWAPDSIREDDPRWERWRPLVAAAKTRRRLRPLVDQLDTWATVQQLSENWILDGALWNLDGWIHNSHWQESLRWRYPGSLIFGPLRILVAGPGIPPTEIPAPDPPRLRAHNPFIETRYDYEKEAKTALAEYAENIERALESVGFRRSVQKRDRGRGRIQHLEWLVQYQVRGLTFRTIGDRARRSRQAVADAVKSSAQLVGISLRNPDQGGRPRGRRGTLIPVPGLDE